MGASRGAFSRPAGGRYCAYPAFPQPRIRSPADRKGPRQTCAGSGESGESRGTWRAAHSRHAKAQPQKEVPARQAAGGKEKQVSAATGRSASPAKSSKAKQAKPVAQRVQAPGGRKRKLATLESEKKQQLAAQKAAQKLFQEWQKSQRAKEVERKRQSKQRAEERLARKEAEQERLRKERLAAQEAAADRVLNRLKREHEKAAGRPVTPTQRPKRGLASRAISANSNRVPPQSPETRAQKGTSCGTGCGRRPGSGTHPARTTSRYLGPRNLGCRRPSEEIQSSELVGEMVEIGAMTAPHCLCGSQHSISFTHLCRGSAIGCFRAFCSERPPETWLC